MQNFKKKDIFFLSAFLGGFFLGIIFINLWGDIYFRNITVFSADSLMSLGEAAIDNNALFLYLAELRGKEFLLLWLTGYTILGLPIIFLILCWLGVSAGVLLTTAIIKMRMTGILMFLATVLPQVFLYVPAVLMTTSGIYEKGKGRWRNRRSFQDWQSEKEYMFLLLSGMACTIAGAALESYINPVLLKWVIKYFL